MVEADDPLLRGAVTPPQHETTLKLLQGEPAAPKGVPYESRTRPTAWFGLPNTRQNSWGGR
jgi:hypothetical protein